MLIGELSHRVGLSRDTIRFYEKNGLIESFSRRDNNYKEYPEETADVLRAVLRLKKHGYTLREIQEFIGLFTNKQSSCAHTAPLLESKLVEIAERITELQRIQKNMKAALKKCADHPNGKACRVLSDFFGETV